MSGVFIFFMAFLAAMLIVTAKQHRRHVAMSERKQCRGCGAVFGAEANFCGRCGKRFGA